MADEKPPLERMALVVGHEIRNPLAVINNSVYYLKAKLGSEADAKVAKHLAIIESEVQQADRVIAQILAYSRRLELRPERRALGALAEEALKAVPMPANVKLEKKLGPRTEVDADPDKLQAAIGHLVRNAAAAMAAGGTLTVRAGSDKDGVFVSVADTGSGISKDQLERVFEPFVTTRPRGVGLGLTLARRIAEAHGGALRLESVEGKGTVATLRLPAAKTRAFEGG